MVSTEEWYYSYCFVDEPDGDLLKFLEEVDNGKALDVACGLGRNSFYLASLGYEVIGVDMSEIAIGMMNEKAKRENSKVKGVVCDIQEYNFSEKFDIIVLSYIFHYFFYHIEQIGILNKFIEYTKEGGLLFIKVPYSDERIGSLSLKEGLLRNALKESDNKWLIIHEEVRFSEEEKKWGKYIFLAKKLGLKKKE